MNPQTDGQAASDQADRGAQQFATFFVDGFFFGVPVVQVQEVLRYQEMTRVPLAPDVIEGLINLRGQIVTAVDMRGRLGLSSRPEGSHPMNMVVRAAEGAVSLLVDEIGDVVEVDRQAFEKPPDNLDTATAELVTAVYKLKDRLLLCLDTDRAIDLSVGVTTRERVH
jgi:purine-binding chemotaxis protein CheW